MSSFLSSINKKKKTPEQLVVSSKELLQQLRSLCNEEGSESKTEAISQISNDLAKSLSEMKIILYGDHDSPASAPAAASTQHVEEEKIKELSHFIQKEDLMILLIQNMDIISFESRKDTALIYSNLAKKNINSFAQHVVSHLFIINELIHAYLNAEVALHCGVMLRESIRFAEVIRYILLENHETLLWPFIDSYLHLPNFDVASDGFNTFKDILLSPSHKAIINEFFDLFGEQFLKKFEILLRSENYVTRRRSLKLLGEILLDRNHYALMMKYVSSMDNLKTIMNLLRHKSPHIQFETFHIFKIFVANPHKPQDIASILFNNKAKLVAYLETFQNDKPDLQFTEEKKLLIETLQQLADPYEEPAAIPAPPTETSALPS